MGKHKKTSRHKAKRFLCHPIFVEVQDGEIIAAGLWKKDWYTINNPDWNCLREILIQVYKNNPRKLEQILISLNNQSRGFEIAKEIISK